MGAANYDDNSDTIAVAKLIAERNGIPYSQVDLLDTSLKESFALKECSDIARVQIRARRSEYEKHVKRFFKGMKLAASALKHADRRLIAATIGRLSFFLPSVEGDGFGPFVQGSRQRAELHDRFLNEILAFAEAADFYERYGFKADLRAQTDISDWRHILDPVIQFWIEVVKGEFANSFNENGLYAGEELNAPVSRGAKFLRDCLNTIDPDGYSDVRLMRFLDKEKLGPRAKQAKTS